MRFSQSNVWSLPHVIFQCFFKSINAKAAKLIAIDTNRLDAKTLKFRVQIFNGLEDMIFFFFLNFMFGADFSFTDKVCPKTVYSKLLQLTSKTIREFSLKMSEKRQEALRKKNA